MRKNIIRAVYAPKNHALGKTTMQSKRLSKWKTMHGKSISPGIPRMQEDHAHSKTHCAERECTRKTNDQED